MKHRFLHFTLLPLGILAATLAPAAAQIKTWSGADGIGGSGSWNMATQWSATGVPTSANEVRFDVTGTLTNPTATVSIDSGVAAAAAAIRVRDGKNLTVNLADTSSLTGTILYVGDTGTGSSSATLQGPATGAATVNLTRFLLTTNTGARNYLTFSGSNLTVNLTGAYSDIGLVSTTAAATVKVAGAKVLGGEYYLRTPANRLVVSSGTLSGTLIDNTGLVQIASTGSLLTSSGTMNLYVRSGGKVEAAGSGIATGVGVRLFTGGTLAVGVSSIDPVTDVFSRTAPATLTLNSRVQFDTQSTLEMGIFGHSASDPNFGIDQLNFATGGSLVLNGAGSLITLDLDTYGYTLQAGDSWKLFTGNVSITGSGAFDLTSLTSQGWDVSQFNSAGGWVLTYAVPEPSSALLAIAGGGLLLALRRRR